MPASVLAWIVAFGSAGISNTGAAPIVERPPPSVAAVINLADKLPPITLASADALASIGSVPETAAVDATPASHEPEPIVTAALPDTSETPQLETPPEPPAKMASLEPGDIGQDAGSTEVVGECPAVDGCVDHYLWALYQRTPKEDSVKIQERKNVTVKKKGKLVNVTRTLTRLTDEDFGWKDPKAAETAGMPLTDYVIGGMDREFKLKLFHMLRAAEEAGLSPGITSAFRDDYRQSIASGLKAADNRSYHGGSLRGGYGHGLAADVVSTNGATRAQRLTSSQGLWQWIDTHGAEFGIARPYLDRDPPHMAPIDGKEFADHRPGMKARQARAAAKPHNNLALPNDRGTAKRAKTARSSRTSRPT